MADQAVNPEGTTEAPKTEAPKAEEIIRKIKAFDLDEFAKTDVEVKCEFTPATTFKEALERFSGDSDKLLVAVNGALRRAVISQAKAEAIKARPNLLPSAKPINDFRNNMRQLPQFVSIEPRKEQTKRIDAFIRSNENVLSALKTLCLVTVGVDEDEDDDNEE